MLFYNVIIYSSNTYLMVNVRILIKSILMLGNAMINDMQLQQYVDQVMARYDFNRSGTLESGELVNFFNDLFSMCGYPNRVNLNQATQMMRQMDSNFDGRANKFELFRAFKSMMANSNNMGGGNNYNNSWNPNYQGNTGFGGGFGGGYNQGGYGGGYNNNMGGGYGGNMGGGYGRGW